jgi:hypothetical protein
VKTIVGFCFVKPSGVRALCYTKDLGEKSVVFVKCMLKAKFSGWPIPMYDGIFHFTPGYSSVFVSFMFALLWAEKISVFFFLPTNTSFFPTLFWGFSGPPPALSYKTYSLINS